MLATTAEIHQEHVAMKQQPDKKPCSECYDLTFSNLQAKRSNCTYQALLLQYHLDSMHCYCRSMNLICIFPPAIPDATKQRNFKADVTVRT